MDFSNGLAHSWLESVNALVPDLDFAVSDVTLVESGQVWRARWDDVVSMVFVDKRIDSFQNLVRVAPVTVGRDMADDTAVILPAGATSLAVSLSVWTELTADIAEVVLERQISVTGRYGSLESLATAVRVGELTTGLPIRNLSGRRAQERREIALVMEALRSAVDLISGNGTLPQMLAAASLTVKALVGALGLASAPALKIAKGSSGVDVPQARVLAKLMNVEVAVVLAGNPVIEDGLITAVTKLSVRPKLAWIEAADGTVDSEALLELTKGALALAARKEGDVSDWDARVNLYFETRFGERL